MPNFYSIDAIMLAHGRDNGVTPQQHFDVTVISARKLWNGEGSMWQRMP